MSSNLQKLCDALRGNIEMVTLRWVRRVQNDPYLKADDKLSLNQIIDHVPQMLEELCDVFVSEDEPNFETIRASSQHGYIRATEGYKLTELLRELELLRDTVFDFIAEVEIIHDFGSADMISGLRRVNEYFSEDIIFVVEHFLSRQKGGTKIE